MNAPPSAFHLERVISMAMSTVEALRTEHGVIIETDGEMLTALAEEGVDVEQILRRLTRAALDAKANAAAVDLRMEDLKLRRDRFRKHEETYRATLANVMEALEISKFSDPEFSLSLSAGKPKLFLVDESQLPETMIVTTIVRSPDKAAIKSALELGADVPGAVLSQPAPVLTLRTK